MDKRSIDCDTPFSEAETPLVMDDAIENGFICEPSTISITPLERWANELRFTRDDADEEVLVDGSGAHVMMEWEMPYMQRCVDALNVDHTCDVLEIGFGCGYAATHIQRKQPRSHTIIECSEPVLQRLRPWAHARPGVRVVEGTWQAELPQLGLFDRIFFDGDTNLHNPASPDQPRERTP
jgi:hypothetical protein